MESTSLKPFDLEAAKLGASVCTRNGNTVRLICFDKLGTFPLVGLIKINTSECAVEQVACFSKDGRYFASNTISLNDLVMQ